MSNVYIVNLEDSYAKLLTSLRLGMGMPDLKPEDIETLFQELVVTVIQLSEVTEPYQAMVSRVHRILQSHGLDFGLTPLRVANLVDIFQTQVLNELATILGESLIWCKSVHPRRHSQIIIRD